MQAGNTDFIHKNELDKTCFQHYMAYGESKDLVKRTQLDKVLKDKAFKIARNSKRDVVKEDQLQWFTSFFNKKSKGSGIVASLANRSANEPNYQLENELHKPIIKKLKKNKSLFIFQRQYLIQLVCND